MSAEQIEKTATRAIIVTENKVLLGKRGRGVGENRYALIGGKIDEGETPEESVIREVKEEIGLELKDAVFWKKAPDTSSIPGERWLIYFFKGKVEGSLSLKEDEVTEVVYAGRGNFENLDIAFNHREILEEFFGLR